MGIGSFIMGKKKRSTDYGDVRMHVLNKPFSDAPQTIGKQMGIDAPAFPKEPFAPEPYRAPPSQPFSPIDAGPEFPRPEPRRDFEREDISIDQKRTSLDVLDRLSIIESQLQAIRSQTETINERLKNMDARLGRRY